MTEYILTAGRSGRLFISAIGLRYWNWRVLAVLVLALMTATSPELRNLVFAAMSDAYIQVTVFVAGTLAVVYAFENAFRFDLGRAMSRARHWQVPIAAALGALPGCGGAIIVMTHYTRGHVSFGGIVAVLIATMGDAAFLLLAREPLTGLGIIVLGFVVGTLSGWLIDTIHGDQFMRGTTASNACPPFRPGPSLESVSPKAETVFNKLWIAWVIPGIVLGLAAALQFDTDKLFGALAPYEPTKIFGVLGAALALSMWAFGRQTTPLDQACPYERSQIRSSDRVIRDTNFVTAWVVMAFLSYELAVHFAGIGIEAWLQIWAPFVPLVAILVGFIPGCGPQIVVTSLYLAGAIPLSAQIGNAISNDGDALFPALALAPKAAVYATLYSAIPALVIAYGYYFFVEAGLTILR